MEFYGQLLANIRNGDSRTFTKEKWDPASWPTTARAFPPTFRTRWWQR